MEEKWLAPGHTAPAWQSAAGKSVSAEEALADAMYWHGSGTLVSTRWVVPSSHRFGLVNG